MTEVENIQKLVSWFFDKINIPVIEGQYINNLQNWDALCASLTILNDLQRSKVEYYDLGKVNHLEAIGIMQTIYIEQDCMLTFHNAILEKSQENYLENYSEIRSLRNEVFGHPSKKAKQKKPKLYSRHFFDIMNAKTQNLKIINWKATGDIDSYQFVLTDKVNENSRITREYLENIKSAFIAKIESKMNDYKVNTVELFKGANYLFEKLLTKQNDRIVINTYHTIDEDLEKAKQALVERNIYDDYQKEHEALVFFSSQLKPLFYIQTYTDVEFYAYASSLRKGIHSFKKSLAEIDDHFRTNETDHFIVFE